MRLNYAQKCTRSEWRVSVIAKMSRANLWQSRKLPSMDAHAIYVHKNSWIAQNDGDGFSRPAPLWYTKWGWAQNDRHVIARGWSDRGNPWSLAGGFRMTEAILCISFLFLVRHNILPGLLSYRFLGRDRRENLREYQYWHGYLLLFWYLYGS